MTRPKEATGIRVDMIRCVGHGICAHVLGELIDLDPWGFPIADAEPFDDPKVIRRARRAARACPRRALLVEAAVAPAAPASGTSKPVTK